MKYLFHVTNELVQVELDNGLPCNINATEYPAEWAWVQEYLTKNPRIDFVAPALSDAQLEAAAEAQRQAFFAEYDLAVKKHTRWIALGIEPDDSMLQKWHQYARELELVNDVPEWWRDTVWPEVPQ